MSSVGDCVLQISMNGKDYEFCYSSTEDHIYQMVLSTGAFYENTLLRALRPFLGHSDFVVDVGANVGNHSVYFAAEAGCRVLAFEPVPITYALLEENIARNGLDVLIGARRYALGAVAGHASAGPIDEHNLGATRLSSDLQDGKIIVRTLDSLPEIEVEKVALIKIDVEGMELDVLRGATSTIDRDRPVIVCECGSDKSFAENSDYLSGLGYRALECFNATATYIFVHKDWIGTDSYSMSDYFADGILRTSQARQHHESELSRLRRMMSVIATRIEQMQD